MTVTIIRRIGKTLTMTKQEISETDNISLPINSTMLDDTGWAFLGALCGAGGKSDIDAHAAIMDRLNQLCKPMGITLDDQTQAP